MSSTSTRFQDKVQKPASNIFAVTLSYDSTMSDSKSQTKPPMERGNSYQHLMPFPRSAFSAVPAPVASASPSNVKPKTTVSK